LEAFVKKVDALEKEVKRIVHLENNLKRIDGLESNVTSMGDKMGSSFKRLDTLE
jgi:hypothetical protein